MGAIWSSITSLEILTEDASVGSGSLPQLRRESSCGVTNTFGVKDWLSGAKLYFVFLVLTLILDNVILNTHKCKQSHLIQWISFIKNSESDKFLLKAFDPLHLHFWFSVTSPNFVSFLLHFNFFRSPISSFTCFIVIIFLRFPYLPCCAAHCEGSHAGQHKATYRATHEVFSQPGSSGYSSWSP